MNTAADCPGSGGKGPERFSRFAHFLQRGEYVAAVNSLKMKPVFVESEILDDVRSALSRSMQSMTVDRDSNDKVAAARAALREVKVLVPSASYDGHVLERARSTIPPPSIDLMYLILTDRCNFDCSYCFVRRDLPVGYKVANMSEEVARRALSLFADLAKRHGAATDTQRNIILYGGEPLLNFQVIAEILRRVQQMLSTGELPQGTNVSLITNGSLLTPKVADALATYRVSVGVSLDGDQATNDEGRVIRGSKRSAYEAAVRAVKTCQDAGVDVGLSVTLTPRSLLHKEELIRTILDLKVSSLGFNTLVNKERTPEDREYYDRAADFIIESFMTFRERGIREDRMCRKVEAYCGGRLYLFDCGAAGGNQIVVAPDGQIGICHAYIPTRENFVSSVFSDGFDPTSFETYRDWNRRTPINMDSCLDCVALGLCGGGCPFNADKLHGTIWSLDERFCVHAKKTAEWLIWEEFQIAKARIATCRALDRPEAN